MKFTKISIIIGLLLLLPAGVYASAAGSSFNEVSKIRVSWEPVTDAAWYRLIVKAAGQEKIVFQQERITTNGYEINIADLGADYRQLTWQVQGLDYQGNALTDLTAPKLLSKGELNPLSPMLTGQAESRAFAKPYPVYSWIPVYAAASYEVEVFYAPAANAGLDSAKLLKTLEVNDGNAWFLYDWEGFHKPGQYWWRVQAKNKQGERLGEWSAAKSFVILAEKVTVAALGDSITHGGGAVSNPPSFVMYDWQTYAGLPILNLGYSGDTTKQLNQRFAKDVLPFSPKILIIMGGINDIRLGVSADSVISELNKLKYRCLLHDIKPVFVTLTPLNPLAMRQVMQLNPAINWQSEREQVNSWIKSQPYFIAAGDKLAAPNGLYLPGLSTDGLHPDAAGKKIIGETIGAYLQSNFGEIVQ